MKRPLPLTAEAHAEIERGTDDLHAWMELALSATRPDAVRYYLWMVKHCASNVAHYQNVLMRDAAFRALNAETRLRAIEADPVRTETGAIVRPLVQRMAA